MWKPLLCLLAAAGGLLTPARAQTAPTESQTLEFVENLGQWPAPVRYCAEIPGGRLFMEPHGLTYSLLARLPDFHGGHPQAAPTAEIAAHSLRVSFEGAAAAPALSSTDQTAEVRNYLRGNDPKQWAHGVRGFRQLRYGQLWPGIEAHFYENRDQQLEYDFELAAQADPAAIRLRYDGADALTLTAEGGLTVRTSVGVLRELAPHAWQTDAAGHRQPVACAYALHDRTVTFQLGAYDPRLPLTIDPTVVFSSFTGSSANNLGFTATYDQQGNMYSGSIAFSAGYPTTTGAFMTSFAGMIDIAIFKFNTAATGPAARAWATYLGGSDAEFPHSLVVGSQGDLFVLGTTSSNNYPTSPAAYDRTFNGGTFVSPFGFLPLQNGSDLVVTRLSANGSTLVGSTFLGGTGNDGLMDPSLTPLVRNWGDAFRGDLLLDANDNIYVASNTTSANFPTTNGLGGAFRGGYDAVVSKLSPTASSLLWSSFLGGTGADAAYSLQLDATGTVYVAGGTTSPNFPTTAGTLLPTAPGGVDGFVARLSRTGTVLEKATYLGTSAYDQGYFLQLDTNGAVYILGQTLGAYPVTPGRYQNPNGRQFIHKLDAGLATTGFSTVFGSGGSLLDISPTAFLVDQCNRIYVSGWGGGENRSPPFSNGGTTGLPITANAFQRTTDGQDFYLMQLSPEALTLDYATYFGQSGGLGDHVDGGTSRFDPRGIVYQAVCICQAASGSLGFPIPPGAGTYSATSGFPSICNNAAFKLNFESAIVRAGSDRSVCQGSPPQLLTGTPGGGVWTGPGVSGSVAAGFVFTPTAALVGTQTLTYTVSGVGPCGGVSTLRIAVTTSPTVTFAPPAQTTFCLGTSVLPVVPLAATPVGGTFSGPGVSGNVFNPNTAGPGTHTITYTVAAGACTLQAALVMTVTRASVGPSFTVCSNSLVPTPLTGTPAGGVWTGQGVSGSVATGFVFTPTAALVGSRVLTYSLTNNGCASTAALTATVLSGPVYVPPTLPAYCVSGPTVALPAGAIWSGRGVQGPGSSNVYTFSPALAGAGTFTIAYRTGFNLCDAVGSVPVTVTTPALISLTADTVLCPGSTQPFRVRALPAGGSWSGPYVSSAGVFTPPADLVGSTTLTYTLNGVCVSTATRRVSVATAPTYAARWDAAQCAATRQAPLTVLFSDPLNSAPGVRWDFGDGSQGAGNPTTHVYAQAGRYAPKIMRAYNNGQCFIQLDLPVVEVTPPYQIPNIITPNGDPDNEYFQATNGCPARLQVFSRWGTKVFEAEQYQNDWNGGPLPNGVYYYHLRQADGTTIKGWVEISR